jgi:hypothetical protein
LSPSFEYREIRVERVADASVTAFNTSCWSAG